MHTDLFTFALIILMPFITRAAGGGVGADQLRAWVLENYGAGAASFVGRLPEILFALPFGYVAALHWATSPPMFAGIFVIAAVWAFVFMETGHGNGYHDGVAEHAFPDRHQSLDYIVRPITNALGFAPRSKWYCRIFMGIKWGLIGLPAFPFGLALMVLGPFAYYVSFRVLRRESAPAEWISGLAAGMVLAIAYGFFI